MKNNKRQILTITIGHLYGELMNIYGDNGNIITIRKRCEWRGIEVKVLNISLKEALKPGVVDLYFFGGGQDQAQELISEDLQTKVKSEAIRADIERGVPLLSICGGYQLLGEYYQPFGLPDRSGKPQKGKKLAGLGIFPAYTDASLDRMIGNLVVAVDSEQLSADSFQIVGFENHSGKTYLKEGAKPLGKVIAGFGNNGGDGFEGCIYKNAVGCYLHGSVLPKNPRLADWLISKALEVKYGKEIELEEINDTLEMQAHDTAVARFSK